jgi:hypothetical protein
MKTALKGTKQGRWKAPRGLINVTLDAETGMPPDAYTLETVTEALTAGQIPTEQEIQEYMLAHQEDFLERQYGIVLDNADPATQQRYEQKFRREQAQREANHRRRLQATQRENERRRGLGIPPLPLPTLAPTPGRPSPPAGAFNNNHNPAAQPVTRVIRVIKQERIEIPEQLF